MLVKGWRALLGRRISYAAGKVFDENGDSGRFLSDCTLACMFACLVFLIDSWGEGVTPKS